MNEKFVDYNEKQIRENFEKQMQKVSPELRNNKKFNQEIEKALQFMLNYDKHEASWPNKHGEVTRGKINPLNYYFVVSDDGKSIRYGYDINNADAYKNGYEGGQFQIYQNTIMMDKNGNMVLVDISSDLNNEHSYSPEGNEKNATFTYNACTIDPNGNEIRRDVVEEKDGIKCNDIKTFRSFACDYRCPNFTQELDLQPLNKQIAVGETKFTTVSRNMLNPAAVRYRRGETKSGNRLTFNEDFYAVQLEQKIDRLYDHHVKKGAEGTYDRLSNEFIAVVNEVERRAGIVKKNEIKR